MEKAVLNGMVIHETDPAVSDAARAAYRAKGYADGADGWIADSGLMLVTREEHDDLAAYKRAIQTALEPGMPTGFINEQVIVVSVAHWQDRLDAYYRALADADALARQLRSRQRNEDPALFKRRPYRWAPPV